MEQQTLGAAIASLRKEHGMTQLQLAERMGVTDKAVSKWERDLSCPDVATIPKLAEIFGVTVDELMQGRRKDAKRPQLEWILKAVAMAMGIAVAVLSLLRQLDPNAGFGMLGLGLACLAFLQLRK